MIELDILAAAMLATVICVNISPASAQTPSEPVSNQQQVTAVPEGEAFTKMWKQPLAERNKVWTAFVDMARRHPLQDGGLEANLTHFCEKESSTCTDGIFYRGVKGPMLVLDVSDYDGKVLGRVTCFFTRAAMDARICQDFDKGNYWRDIQDIKGKWNTVEEEAAH